MEKSVEYYEKLGQRMVDIFKLNEVGIDTYLLGCGYYTKTLLGIGRVVENEIEKISATKKQT